MDDTVQLKKHIDDTVAALTRRLANAHQRKAKAEQEAKSSDNEINLITKALQDFKPLQGFFGSVAAMAAVAAATATERGSNRQIIVTILTKHGAPMTNGEIAKVAHEQASIKSKKGLPGVYATVATVLARGKDRVFVNHSGQWDLRLRPRPMNQVSLSALAREGENAPAETPPNRRKDSMGAAETAFASRTLDLAGMPRLR